MHGVSVPNLVSRLAPPIVGQGFEGSNVKFLKPEVDECWSERNKDDFPPKGMIIAAELSGGHDAADIHWQPGASFSPTAHNV